MKFVNRYTIIILSACLFVSCVNDIDSQSPSGLSEPLHITDTKILNSNDDVIFLKGCNLGNWLILEMWMLDYRQSGSGDQYEFELQLSERFGASETHRLMELYRSSWAIERDFKMIKSFGMNTIRLPFEYRLLMDDDKPFQLKEDAWFWLDKAVNLATKHDMFIILDMHGAPGRQSGMDHTGRSGYNRLWEEAKYQDQTEWLWVQISKHYKDNPTIAAYDFLNEPWGGEELDLKKMILRCYEVVRAENDNHIVIFPGHYSGIDFYEDEHSKSLTNVLYTAHFYPGFFGWGGPVPQVHADFLENGLMDWKETMDRFNAPLLIGEFNVVSQRAGGGEMMRRYYDRYEKWGWPATMWSYKVLTQQGGINEMNWGMVTNEKPLAKLDIKADDLSEIETWFKSLATMEYSVNSDLQYWLTTDETPSLLDDLPPLPPPITKAPAVDPLPGKWQASDIGEPLEGGQIVDGDTWTVYGGGADIWTDNDQFRYIWHEVEGDFSVRVTVNELLSTNTYAKAGIMARNSLDPQSSHVLINIFPFGNTEFGYRIGKGEMMQASGGNSAILPGAELELTRKGNTFIGKILIDGEWQVVGEISNDEITSRTLLGLATLSHDNNRLTKAVFDNFNFLK
jgi:endoglucanase